MIKVQVTELYPIYIETDEDGSLELPDDLAERLRDSAAAFMAVQQEIRELNAERARERRMEEHRAAILARRVARGPGRIRRRPRPVSGQHAN